MNFTKWQETSGKTWISYWIPAWPLKTGEASLQTLWGCDLILAEAIEDGFVQDLIGTSTAAPWYWQLWHGNSLDVPRLHLVGHRPIDDAAVFARAKYEMIRNGMIRLLQAKAFLRVSAIHPKRHEQVATSLLLWIPTLALSAKMTSSPCLGLLRGLVQAFQPGCLSSGSSGENPPVWGWFRPVYSMDLYGDSGWWCQWHWAHPKVTSTIPSMVHKPWTNQPDLDGTGEPLWFSNPLTVIILIMPNKWLKTAKKGVGKQLSKTNMPFIRVYVGCWDGNPGMLNNPAAAMLLRWGNSLGWSQRLMQLAAGSPKVTGFTRGHVHMKTVIIINK